MKWTLLLLEFCLQVCLGYKVNHALYLTQQLSINGSVSAFQSSGDGKMFFAGTKEGLLYVYRLAQDGKIQTDQIIEVKQSINALALGGKGETLGVALGNGSAVIYQVHNTLTQKQVLTGSNHPLLSIEFSDDFKTLLAGGAEGTIQVYRFVNNTYSLDQKLQDGNGGVRKIKLVKGERVIVIGNDDKAVRVYAIEEGGNKFQLAQVVMDVERQVCSIDVSEEGLVAVGLLDSKIRLYMLSEDEKTILPFQTILDATGGIKSVKLAKDSTLLLAGGDDSVIRVYEKSEGKFEFQYDISGINFAAIYVSYNELINQVQVLSEDGVFRRYLNCPILTCNPKCSLLSECPSCYHPEYFTSIPDSAYCNKIEGKVYQLKKQQVEYENSWYEQWWVWVGFLALKVVGLLVMHIFFKDARRRWVMMLTQLINRLRGKGKQMTETHIELPQSVVSEVEKSNE